MTTDSFVDTTALLRQLIADFSALGQTTQRILACGLDRDMLMEQLVPAMRASGENLSDEAREFFSDLAGVSGLSPQAQMRPVEASLRRALAEATSPLPDQTPAIECAVMFFGGASIMGVLSETPEGGLRMLSPNPDPNARRACAAGEVAMTEQFFGYDDVLMFGVTRIISMQAPRIVTAS
jgi:hypothetical protein